MTDEVVIRSQKWAIFASFGNVGVRVTLRVAIMSTTGEWPECDQGDEALLALASNEIMPGPVHRHQ